jgi:ATP-binding cassette subfamily F protein uup
LKFNEQRELEAIEETIMAAESAVSELENMFMSPDFHSKYGQQTRELNEQLESARQEVERLYARWEELEAIKSGNG